MSYTPEEQSFIRYDSALKLLRHKTLTKIATGRVFLLEVEDINEVLVTAGLPVIVPDEVNAKEVTIIKTREEKKNDTV